ncbi:hypothetical protein D3C81_2022840 [compost metagenome]
MGIYRHCLSNLFTLTRCIRNQQIFQHQLSASQKQGWSRKGSNLPAVSIRLPRVAVHPDLHLSNSDNCKERAIDPHLFFIDTRQNV